MQNEPRRAWAVILAGGEGTRLSRVTMSPDGVSVPKQFCTFRSDRSLLGATLDRVARLVPKDRIVVVVAERHRPWWTTELADLPRANVLVEPVGRGTAAGLLLALLHVQLQDPDAAVLTLPSDHHATDEAALVRGLEAALSSARRDGQSVLLGMRPDAPDFGYGWIVPADDGEDATRRVAAFVEKPDKLLAQRLFQQGGLWSSMTFAAPVRTLVGAFERSLPLLARTLRDRCLAAGYLDRAALAQVYPLLPSHDFSRDVLEGAPDLFRVLAVPWCGWSDLGTPMRVLRCLHRAAPAATPRRRAPRLGPSRVDLSRVDRLLDAMPRA